MKQYFKNYLKLLNFAKDYKLVMLGAVLCMGVSTLFEGVSLGMIGPLIDRVFTNKKIVIPGDMPDFIVQIIDRLNAIDSQTFLNFIIIFLPLLFLVKGIFLFLQEYLMNVVGQGVVRDVRNRLYSKFQELSMDFYAKSKVGELMSRVTNDVSIITNAISYAFKDLAFQSMKLVFFSVCAIGLGFKISWKLPLVIFVLFPAIMFPVTRVARKIKRFTVEVQKRIADLNTHMSETISGAHIVKAFCREKFEINKFKEINQHYYKFSLKSIKRTLFLSPLTEFVGILGAALILSIIGKELLAERISFGSFATFMVFLMSIIQPLKKLSNVHAINQKALAASTRIYEILDEQPTIKEKPGALAITDFKKDIVFTDLYFSYNKVDGDVLKNVDLTVKKGEMVAFVGHSGAGKTTLVNLLPRFYDPDRGYVSIDDKRLTDLKTKDLRSMISIVSQESVLFNTTVKENIAYGKDEVNEALIIEAARRAHALEFIDSLPDRFDTIIGDRGLRLSGGEKQRISIARAIVKDSPILILDEATSQLDSVSERLIQDAFAYLMKGKTVFVIAHRLATIQKADKIVVMEKGRIVEQGRHEDLIKSAKLYKKLYELQFSE
ncbi:MAG: ABC transporter ATP-binding protein [Candidatus Omnitrophica bacterium]|nr:ABC transporter ATP-binding protein [Candidatus Omnitrophota bacterium]